MAMIFCPKCGKEISNQSKKCIHCGKPLTEETEKSVSERFCPEFGKEVFIESQECPSCGYPLEPNDTFINPNAKKTIPSKKVIIIAIATLILVLIIGLVINYNNSLLNEDEQFACRNVETMQGMMKNPESFQLYDEMFLIKKFSENGTLQYTYTIFKYGGTNSYGAFLTDEAIFKDRQYLMDYADEPDKDSSDYVDQLQAKLDISKYLLEGDSDRLKMVEINIEKIKNKLGL